MDLLAIQLLAGSMPHILAKADEAAVAGGVDPAGVAVTEARKVYAVCRAIADVVDPSNVPTAHGIAAALSELDEAAAAPVVKPAGKSSGSK